MKLNILSLLALNVALGQPAKCSEPAGLTVETSSGAFTGMIEPEFPNTRQWRSIPFAEPPVGPRRWLPPQKISTPPPQGRPRFSTKFPPSCSQFFTSLESMWNIDLTKGNLVYNGAQNDSSGLVGEATSEDCLHLAVWAPTEIPEEGLPVLFFMTGGGFYIGGVGLPWQIPTSWVERTKSHIVVSVNYRINIFGFPNARGLDDQNLGILDQRLALEWVRDNAAAFGGDPTRIMQWGRSAGGMAADVHSYAYHDDPIAESYYMESGLTFGGLPPNPRDFTGSNFTFVARGVGCGSPCGARECADEDEHAAAELDCMRQVSPIQISNFIGKYGDQGGSPPLSFGPVPDDRIVYTANDYHARSEAGLIARIPAMISFTANEWSSLTPWPADDPSEGPPQGPLDTMTVAFAVCSALNATAYRNRLDVPVFRFQYAATFPNLNVYDWLGAYHNAETPLIFGTYGLLDHIADTTEFQVEVSESMQDHILAFARDPYNGPQKLGWLPMDTRQANGGDMIRFGGKSGKVVTHVDGIELDGVCLGVGEYDSFP